MGSINIKVRPEKLTLGEYLGVGTFGGYVFSVMTGYVDDYPNSGEIKEPMVLLDYEEYKRLNRRTPNEPR